MRGKLEAQGPRESAGVFPGGRWVASVSFSVLLTVLVLSGRGQSQAQLSCDQRWASLQWHGWFTLTVTADGVDSSGSHNQVNNSATASFATDYLLNTTTFTNDFGRVNETATTSCAPQPGNQVNSYVGGGRFTADSWVQITPDLIACTYSLGLNDNIMGEYLFQPCGSPVLDLGPGLFTPSLGELLDNSQLRNIPLPPFGQPLAGTIIDRSITWGSAPGTLTFSWNITPLSMVITSVQTPTFVNNKHTFVTTDPITIKATITPAVANVPVKWTITGMNAADGVTGFPTAEVHNTDASGVSTLVFTPNNNGALVANRHTAWRNGSRAPNTTISFDVIAEMDQGRTATALFQAGLGTLEQDEKDILRQEYLDILQPVPTRAQAVASLDRPWNNGNYSVQLDSTLKQHFNAILASYRATTVTVNGQAVPMRADALLVVSSGFRSPQLNKAIGSVHPESLHTRGRALDLQPMPVTVMVGGQPVALNLHAALYPALAAAVSAQGLSPLPEESAKPVPLGDPRENHIHVQW
jgi:hypothetical protein